MIIRFWIVTIITVNLSIKVKVYCAFYISSTNDAFLRRLENKTKKHITNTTQSSSGMAKYLYSAVLL